MDLVEIVGLVNLPTNLIVTFVPIASDPEGQLSNQSDIPASSEVIINCVVSKDNL